MDKRRQTLQETTNNIDHIEKYLNSTVRENLLRAVANFQPATTLRKHEYYNYRAVLIGEIVFRSAQRSGVVSGMRKSEVITALEQDSQGKIVVFEHKTGKLRPAVVFLETLATAAFQNYLKEILPQIDKSTDSNGPFFISYNGTKINHAGIQSSLNTLIHLTGISKTMTATKSRIAAATFVATSNPGQTQVVADYMQHQASTADKYYRQMGGGDHLVKGFNAIGEMTHKNK